MLRPAPVTNATRLSRDARTDVLANSRCLPLASDQCEYCSNLERRLLIGEASYEAESTSGSRIATRSASAQERCVPLPSHYWTICPTPLSLDVASLDTLSLYVHTISKGNVLTNAEVMGQMGKVPMSNPSGATSGMTRRDFLGGALAGASLIALSGCRFAGSDRGGGAGETINVGVILPLSGGAAQAGENARDGIRMIADKINEEGGIKSLDGAKIELKVADSTEEPSTAATVAQRFISRNDVVAVLGCYSSSLSLAVSEVTERQRIPFITMSYTDELTSRGFEYLFQVTPKASVIGDATLAQAIAIGEEAGDQAIERIAIMYEDTAYGTSQEEGLRKSAQEAGVAIVMNESFPFGITDVSPLVNELRGADAQIVFPISGSIDDAVKIVRGMRGQGLEPLIVGGSGGYVLPDFEEALGEDAQGVLSINTSNWDLAPEVTKEFEQRYGYFMVHEAIEHAATMRVLAEALETAGSTDAEEVKRALADNVVSGGMVDAMPGKRIEFDKTGLNTVAYPIMTQWQEGELVTVYPEEVSAARPIWPGVGG